jgi:hypothetical protein
VSALPAIRNALEVQLSTLGPFATAYENVTYAPVAGTPYQQVTLLPATPDNPEMGPGYTEQGIFQINSFFPKEAGPAAATARAEAIRAAFPFAASFVSAGVTVNVVATPEIGPGRPDGDRFMIPTKVRWSARVNGG